ncbi:MAG: thiamine pyrophosphate-binding protein [Alphaproteobacteria bacterium]|nr:thiamine pyrophosphate-binding protein [Alphaproteobacteria bacterium]
MEKTRCATAIINALEALGTEIAFVYNGHGNWALLDAIAYESGIKGVACRGEDQAVHMADGYYRSGAGAGIPLVCTSVGPGNMNIASALATAFFESSGMLVLAGAGSTHWLEQGGIEEFYRYAPDEWIQTVKAYTKKAVMVSRPDTAVDTVLRAYKTAVTGRPGPVVVQLPFDIQHSDVVAGDLSQARQMVEVRPPGPDPSAIEAAAKLIAASERPLVFVSGGIRHAKAHEALETLVERFGLPVGTTAMGKGAYPEDKPLCLGAVGRAGTGHANQAAQECDLLLAIGTHFSDVDTGGWTLFDIPGGTKLVHIDIDVGEIARVYPTEIGIVSDARLALLPLIEKLDGLSLAPERWQSWRAEIAGWWADWEQEVAPSRTEATSPLTYAYVCHNVSEALGKLAPEASVFVDTGHLLSFAPPFFKTVTPHFHHCGFFHKMGWSLPAALGARLARPDHPAIAVLGDGSFVFANSVLATAYELDITVIAILLNNKSLQIERELMERLYGRRAFVDYTDARTGEMWGPDFLKIAEAMGAGATKVDTPEALIPALEEALASGVSHVIDVEIDVTTPGYRSVWYPYPNDFWAAKDG